MSLIVVSKAKQLIKESEMNTSAEAIGELDKIVQKAISDAIVKAKSDGRKTVMARDFPQG